MKQLEFDSAMLKLKNQFGDLVSSPSRATMIWHRWNHLPNGVFEKAIDQVVYVGGFTPNGDRIDAAIQSSLQAYKSANADYLETSMPACDTCSHNGYVAAFNNQGNSVVVACICPRGQSLLGRGAVSEAAAIEAGYKRFKLPLSFKVKRHKDWVHADRTKYCAKLVAIFNTVQRCLLSGGSSGLRGVGIRGSVSEDDAFKIYELMRAGNETDLLITRINNELHANDKERTENV